MTKTEVVEKIRQVISVEPRVDEDDRDIFCDLNGLLFFCVSGSENDFKVVYNDGGDGCLEPLDDVENLSFETLPESVVENLALARKAGTFTVPAGAVSLEGFDYFPGGKWDCGRLSLEADTPLGPLVWEEVIPGPRHSEDSHELQVTLNGKEIDMFKHDLHHDFEPPNKAGKWADKFATSRDELEEDLKDWFDFHRLVLAALIN